MGVDVLVFQLSPVNSMINKYDKYLDSKFSEDYWSDEGISYAVALLNVFTKIDWDLLSKEITGKSTPWLVRCAQTLGDMASADALLVLMRLLKIENPEVRLTALDSINAIASTGFNIKSNSLKLREAINDLKPTAGKITELVIASLEKKLT